MARTPDLRRYLGEDPRPEDLHKQIKESIVRSARYDRSGGETEAMSARYEQERAVIADLEDRARMLREEAATLNDEEFDRRADEIERDIAEAGRRVMDGHEPSPERFVTKFTEWKEVRSLGDFLDTFPMYWVPTKAEVGRVLAVAKRMHERRVEAGERTPGDPIEILDIGGGNGALGKLVVDLARENGLRVDYVIVDPHAAAVDVAKAAYTGVGEMSFVKKGSSDFIRDAYADDPELGPLEAGVREVVAEGNRKLKDFKTFARAVERRAEEGKIDQEELKRMHAILAENFDIRLSEDTYDDPERFAMELMGGWDDVGMENLDDMEVTYLKRLNDEAREAIKRLERALAARSAARDLVINSWMPPGVDFTADIRAANGAAALYFVETYGATGLQEHAAFSGRPRRIGEDDSYLPGENYREHSAWVGRSAPELANKRRLGDYAARNEVFCNAALVQVRGSDAQAAGLKVDPAENGIVVAGEYPWEAELRQTRGEPSSVVPLPKGERRHGRDYHATIERLAERQEHPEDYVD